MNEENFKKILARLRRELQDVKDLDPETQRESGKIRRYVDELEDPQNRDLTFTRNRVKELEAHFAAVHPTLERLARELADALAKMGV